MSVAPKLLTADELLRMPHQCMRLELVKGELRTTSPAGSEHGSVAMRLSWRLGQFIEYNRLGVSFGAETGFKIGPNPDTVRAPDFALLSRDRVPAGGLPKDFFPGAPDLAVEVLSQDDRAEEVNEKVLDWLNAGCQSVWIVDARVRTVAIYHSRNDIRIIRGKQELADDAMLPGFRCQVAELFPAA